MTGIAAVLRRDGAPAPRAELRRMMSALEHRGRVAQATLVDCSVGLAQRASRDDRSSVPRALPDGLLVVADARLDNRDELRSAGLDLDDDTTEAEVIARAYARWSTACVERLLGDFAFVLWDRERRLLLCARDPLGVRPLYTRTTERGIYVASE
ncbi:MAG: asparagine synthetase B, partial [Deltaproteobacteria bacterium]|nr:asparagine synthetase B [Deltaproteobacteria bacterium]MBW2535210.1 asparagine synthetase B [Deltaproteobacteria bacterium]